MKKVITCLLAAALITGSAAVLPENGITNYTIITAEADNTKPKKTTIKTLKCVSSKRFKITYKKVSGATGYQIRYSTSSKFTNAKTVNVKGTSKVVKKLKTGKAYYVKVRAYRSVNGKKMYGNFSKVRKIKLKNAPPIVPVDNSYETWFLADTDFDGEKELVEVYKSDELNSYGNKMLKKTFRIYETKSKHTDMLISYPENISGGMSLCLIKDGNKKKSYPVAMGSHQFGVFDMYSKFDDYDNKTLVLRALCADFYSTNPKFDYYMGNKKVSSKKYRSYWKKISILYQTDSNYDLYENGAHFEEQIKAEKRKWNI